MEILLENIDLILVAAVIIISAIVFARRGQIDLLRELILDIAGTVDTSELYTRLPKLTRLLLSNGTVEKIVNESTVAR